MQQHRDNYRNYGNGGGTFGFTRLTTGLPGNNNTGDSFASFLLGRNAIGKRLFPRFDPRRSLHGLRLLR